MSFMNARVSNESSKFEKYYLHSNRTSLSFNKLLNATVLQIILENHELCNYAKISLHIHIIVDLNHISQ